MRRPVMILALLGGAVLIAVLAWPREATAPVVAPDDGAPGAGGGGDETQPPPRHEPLPATPGSADAGTWRSARHRDRGTPGSRMSVGDAGTHKDRPPARHSRRLLEHVTIEPLEGSATELTPEDVAEVFDKARDEIHACMQAREIPRSDFRASRDEDRKITFEVDAQGQVRADSLVVDPPLPEGLAECYAAGFGGAQASASGGHGARVEVDMPALRSRRDAVEAEGQPRPARRR